MVEIKLFVADDVFQPNATSELLISAVQNEEVTAGSVLDLGCGTGVVAIALGETLKPGFIGASDLSKDATCASKNFELHGIEADVRCGPLFEPWHDTKFDLIIDDISGISSEVALMSEWFDGVPCESGIDGTDLIVQVLSAAKNHLNVGGAIYFPVLSLSNRTRIFQEAKEHFNEIDLIESCSMAVTGQFVPHFNRLEELASLGYIELEKKFGMYLCYTEIYRARTPLDNKG